VTYTSAMTGCNNTNAEDSHVEACSGNNTEAENTQVEDSDIEA